MVDLHGSVIFILPPADVALRRWSGLLLLLLEALELPASLFGPGVMKQVVSQ